MRMRAGYSATVSTALLTHPRTRIQHAYVTATDPMDTKTVQYRAERSFFFPFPALALHTATLRNRTMHDDD